MKSIQTTALILWLVIFIVAAFILGQFLVSKNIFDVTGIITGQGNDKEDADTKIDDELANDIVIDKIGQETVRVGLNIAEEYFVNYYKQYVNYIMYNSDSYPAGKSILINDTLASDYVFYAISNGLDDDKYNSEEENNNITITEAEINSFIDKMFGKEIDEAYKKDGKYGYDKTNKKYNMEKNDDYEEYVQELENIENVTSNEMILTYNCKKLNEEGSKTEEKNSITLTVMYKGGRYIVTEVQKEN